MVKPLVHIVSLAERVREVLGDRLRKAGYLVSTSRAEAEAIAALGAQHPAAVIVDIRGKGSGTFEFLNQVKAKDSDTCVLLLGPDREAGRVARLLRGGAFDYLTLPIEPGRLEESLRQGLQLRRAFRKVRGLSRSLRTANQALVKDRENLKRWNDSLTQVHQLSQAISGTLNADEIISIVAHRLAQVMRFDLIAVSWPQRDHVWVQAPGWVDPDRIRAFQAGLLAPRRKGQQRSRRVTMGRTCLGLPGKHASAIEMPLRLARQERGVIHLERRHGRPFNEEDGRFLDAIAPSVASALHNADAHSYIQSLAMTDGLTGLLNRRAFEDQVARALQAGERYRVPACLVMADLDDFKRVNDQLGHPRGDELLREVARLMSQAVRVVDVVARYGGEEFALILPQADMAAAKVLAERIRTMIEVNPFVLDGIRVKMTVSMGIAGIPHAGITKAEGWVAAADQALYRAKAQGRNRVECHDGALELERAIPAVAYALPGR